MKSENYIVLQGWMIEEMKLKNAELLIFAIIHGFSQDGENQFTGSLQYLIDWTQSSKPTVINALKSLQEKGFIEKTEETINGVKFCKYRSNFTGGKNSLPGVKNLDGGWLKNLTGGGKNFLPNNTNNKNKENNKRENIKEKAEKHRFGEYENVLLTEEELVKLKAEFPEDWQKRIDTLSGYMKSTGKSYKDHLATIRNWARREGEGRKKETDKKQGYVGRGFDYYANIMKQERERNVVH